ncbi:nucleotide exchange factor GrpE [Candidatus Kaiserbacteria bacterium]|nr:nucleotide exchange factor GrpE [Candidatus Kaiserbacteria bacterium]
MHGTRDDEKRVPEEGLVDVDYSSEEEFGDVASAKSKLKNLRDELEAVKKEKQEYLDGWQRCKADAVNQKRDLEASYGRAASAASADLIESLLPALDSFEMAMGGVGWQTVDAAWRRGVESIWSQLLAALSAVGAVRFGTTGEAYDPILHEILQEEDSDGESGSILRVVRSGWKIQGKILRPAQVIVAK